MIDSGAVLTFLEKQNRPVEEAWARYLLGQGTAADVTTALRRYQNADGGFGRGLEVDISASESQPFATRLAMHVLIDTGIESRDAIVAGLAAWLEQAQDRDGCWRLSDAVLSRPIAPWFAGWVFPSLNPALCLAGGAARIGIGSPALFSRVNSLIHSLAREDQAEDGEFYDVLPYAEYFPWIDHPNAGRMIDATARGIAKREYEDAGHFFEHAGPASGALASRLDPCLITAQLDRLESEQQADGGWPSPYHPAWRPWASAHALSVLDSYGRLGRRAAG